MDSDKDTNHTIVYYYSIDGDGALLKSQSEYEEKNGVDLIKANEVLIHHIKQKKSDAQLKYAQVIQRIVCGSLRQGFEMDVMNAYLNNNGSVFIALLILQDAVNAEIDEFLLSDLGYLFKRARPPGTNFRNIITELKKNLPIETYIIPEAIIPGHDVERRKLVLSKFDLKKNISAQFDSCFCDRNKIILIYSQVHRAASQFAEQTPIIFNFYDDHCSILTMIKKFFAVYPKLIPKNVRLKLYLYKRKGRSNNTELSLFSEIRGQGFLNKDYLMNMCNTLDAFQCDKRRAQQSKDYSSRTYLKEKINGDGNSVTEKLFFRGVLHERINFLHPNLLPKKPPNQFKQTLNSIQFFNKKFAKKEKYYVSFAISQADSKSGVDLDVKLFSQKSITYDPFKWRLIKNQTNHLNSVNDLSINTAMTNLEQLVKNIPTIKRFDAIIQIPGLCTEESKGKLSTQQMLNFIRECFNYLKYEERDRLILHLDNSLNKENNIEKRCVIM